MLFPMNLTLTYNNLIENKLNPSASLTADLLLLLRKHNLMVKLQLVPNSKNKQVEELIYPTL